MDWWVENIMIKNYYDILGLTKDADSTAIKVAYRKKAIENHPDKNQGSNEAEIKIKEINEAYEVLKDPAKKKNYDMFGTVNPAQAGHRYGPGATDQFSQVFQDVGGFEDFLEQFNVHFSGRRQMKNADLRAELSISLFDAFTGTTVPFSITLPNGSENNLKVDIPAGVDHGIRIRIKGKGSQQNTNIPAGDLFITIRVKEHPIFKRMGADLFSHKNISMTDAMLGREIEVDLIDGSTVKVKIPAGTQPEQKIRLKQKGMSKLNGTARGDYYLIMNVVIPMNLTKKQIDLLHQFDEAGKK